MSFLKSLFGKKEITTQVFDISLERMKTSFRQMQEQAGWDTNKKLFWGYYFLDHDLKKLEQFAKKLKKSGFEIVEIRQLEKNIFLLHSEEHVSHSPDSLFEQCHQLAKLAISNTIEIFDGWDVEPIQINKGLVE